MKPTRIEVIDHRKNAPDLGRLPSSQIEVSWQDNDMTLKIFINDMKEQNNE